MTRTASYHSYPLRMPRPAVTLAFLRCLRAAYPAAADKIGFDGGWSFWLAKARADTPSRNARLVVHLPDPVQPAANTPARPLPEDLQ